MSHFDVKTSVCQHLRDDSNGSDTTAQNTDGRTVHMAHEAHAKPMFTFVEALNVAYGSEQCYQ